MNSADPKRVGLKQLLGYRLTRISLSYGIIMIVGLTTFYFAKQDVDANRQRIMKVKQEINATDTKYPNRFELIKAKTTTTTTD